MTLQQLFLQRQAVPHMRVLQLQTQFAFHAVIVQAA